MVSKAKKAFDVVVCGGGPGGIAAALGAARAGAETLLIERYGFLGGGATAMLVNPWMTFKAGERQIIFGVLQELIERLQSMGAYGHPRSAHAFDPEALKVVAENLCREASVSLLYHTFLTGTRVENGRIAAVQVANKAGLSEYTAEVYVDSTGDGDLAWMAGSAVEKGREEDGLSQPMTLNFRVANVDIDRMPSREEINQKYNAAKERGEIDCPRENVLFFYATQAGVIHFNTTRVVMKDATDPWELTEAEIEARRQTWQIVAFLKREVAGFADAYLQMTAPQIGVRESRRVMGQYVMTAEDCLTARKFADCIARGSYPVDIHNPVGEGTVIKRVPPGEWYEIPYRCLLPLKIRNLLIGSRCVSATHEAHSAIRVQPIVIAMGQAAGAAAGLCVRHGLEPRALDVPMLQKELVLQGQRFDKPGIDLPQDPKTLVLPVDANA